MKPLNNRAPEGRANPKGIPYLYLATTEAAAVSEQRPWVGSYVSLGLFATTRELKLVDFTKSYKSQPLFLKEPSKRQKELAVWSHIDRAFAEPTMRSDDAADYAETQIIAEMFKNAGFDGVAYKSNFGKDAYNVALFDLAAADLEMCRLVRVTGITFRFTDEDSPYYVSKSKAA